eukprot:m.253825 g.253825  ORF g.253825 m.253825 type:complete len:1961 (+) comp18572_c0_seq1:360-6242(+)
MEIQAPKKKKSSIKKESEIQAAGMKTRAAGAATSHESEDAPPGDREKTLCCDMFTRPALESGAMQLVTQYREALQPHLMKTAGADKKLRECLDTLRDRMRQALEEAGAGGEHSRSALEQETSDSSDSTAVFLAYAVGQALRVNVVVIVEVNMTDIQLLAPNTTACTFTKTATPPFTVGWPTVVIARIGSACYSTFAIARAWTEQEMDSFVKCLVQNVGMEGEDLGSTSDSEHESAPNDSEPAASRSSGVVFPSSGYATGEDDDSALSGERLNIGHRRYLLSWKDLWHINRMAYLYDADESRRLVRALWEPLYDQLRGYIEHLPDRKTMAVSQALQTLLKKIALRTSMIRYPLPSHKIAIISDDDPAPGQAGPAASEQPEYPVIDTADTSWDNVLQASSSLAAYMGAHGDTEFQQFIGARLQAAQNAETSPVTGSRVVALGCNGEGKSFFLECLLLLMEHSFTEYAEANRGVDVRESRGYALAEHLMTKYGHSNDVTLFDPATSLSEDADYAALINACNPASLAAEGLEQLEQYRGAMARFWLDAREDAPASILLPTAGENKGVTRTTELKISIRYGDRYQLLVSFRNKAQLCETIKDGLDSPDPRIVDAYEKLAGKLYVPLQPPIDADRIELLPHVMRRVGKTLLFTGCGESIHADRCFIHKVLQDLNSSESFGLVEKIVLFVPSALFPKQDLGLENIDMYSEIIDMPGTDDGDSQLGVTIKETLSQATAALIFTSRINLECHSNIFECIQDTGVASDILTGRVGVGILCSSEKSVFGRFCANPDTGSKKSIYSEDGQAEIQRINTAFAEIKYRQTFLQKVRKDFLQANTSMSGAAAATPDDTSASDPPMIYTRLNLFASLNYAWQKQWTEAGGSNVDFDEELAEALLSLTELGTVGSQLSAAQQSLLASFPRLVPPADTSLVLPVATQAPHALTVNDGLLTTVVVSPMLDTILLIQDLLADRLRPVDPDQKGQKARQLLAELVARLQQSNGSGAESGSRPIYATDNDSLIARATKLSRIKAHTKELNSCVRKLLHGSSAAPLRDHLVKPDAGAPAAAADSKLTAMDTFIAAIARAFSSAAARIKAADLSSEAMRFYFDPAHKGFVGEMDLRSQLRRTGSMWKKSYSGLLSLNTALKCALEDELRAWVSGPFREHVESGKRLILSKALDCLRQGTRAMFPTKELARAIEPLLEYFLSRPDVSTCLTEFDREINVTMTHFLKQAILIQGPGSVSNKLLFELVGRVMKTAKKRQTAAKRSEGPSVDVCEILKVDEEFCSDLFKKFFSKPWRQGFNTIVARLSCSQVNRRRAYAGLIRVQFKALLNCILAVSGTQGPVCVAAPDFRRLLEDFRRLQENIDARSVAHSLSVPNGFAGGQSTGDDKALQRQRLWLHLLRLIRANSCNANSEVPSLLSTREPLEPSLPTPDGCMPSERPDPRLRSAWARLVPPAVSKVVHALCYSEKWVPSWSQALVAIALCRGILSPLSTTLEIQAAIQDLITVVLDHLLGADSCSPENLEIGRRLLTCPSNADSKALFTEPWPLLQAIAEKWKVCIVVYDSTPSPWQTRAESAASLHTAYYLVREGRRWLALVPRALGTGPSPSSDGVRVICPRDIDLLVLDGPDSPASPGLTVGKAPTTPSPMMPSLSVSLGACATTSESFGKLRSSVQPEVVDVSDDDSVLAHIDPSCSISAAQDRRLNSVSKLQDGVLPPRDHGRSTAPSRDLGGSTEPSRDRHHGPEPSRDFGRNMEPSRDRGRSQSYERRPSGGSDDRRSPAESPAEPRPHSAKPRGAHGAPRPRAAGSTERPRIASPPKRPLVLDGKEASRRASRDAPWHGRGSPAAMGADPGQGAGHLEEREADKRRRSEARVADRSPAPGSGPSSPYMTPVHTDARSRLPGPSHPSAAAASEPSHALESSVLPPFPQQSRLPLPRRGSQPKTPARSEGRGVKRPGDAQADEGKRPR